MMQCRDGDDRIERRRRERGGKEIACIQSMALPRYRVRARSSTPAAASRATTSHARLDQLRRQDAIAATHVEHPLCALRNRGKNSGW